MLDLRRIAVGTVQVNVSSGTILWALVEGLRRSGHEVQVFHDRAEFSRERSSAVECGQNTRYLDPWIMSEALCREYFCHATQGADLSLVLGDFNLATNANSKSHLETLCNWLDMPRVALVDVGQLDLCHLPPRPAGLAGILLDRVPVGELSAWQTQFEMLWGVPVLGALPTMAAERDRFASLGRCQRNSHSASEAIHSTFSQRFQTNTFWKLASQRWSRAVEPKYFRPGNQLRGLTVAMAYDEAFCCYFPAVLDVLELQGAKVVDFSPLRDESLPDGCDVVYLGCGPLENHAATLAANHCMKMALRNHVGQGRRLFAEGSGLAYLSEQVVLQHGHTFPMAGVFPLTAVQRKQPAPAEPDEAILPGNHWLGPAGARLRGYRVPNWDFDSSKAHLFFEHAAVGSRLHMNFAACPEFLARFAPTTKSSRLFIPR